MDATRARRGTSAPTTPSSLPADDIQGAAAAPPRRKKKSRFKRPKLPIFRLSVVRLILVFLSGFILSLFPRTIGLVMALILLVMHVFSLMDESDGPKGTRAHC